MVFDQTRVTTKELLLRIIRTADRNFEKLQSEIDELKQRIVCLEDNAHCPNEACEKIKKGS